MRPRRTHEDMRIDGRLLQTVRGTLYTNGGVERGTAKPGAELCRPLKPKLQH